MERTVWKLGRCHSWYQSKGGYVIAVFPGLSFTYPRFGVVVYHLAIAAEAAVYGFEKR